MLQSAAGQRKTVTLIPWISFQTFPHTKQQRLPPSSLSWQRKENACSFPPCTLSLPPSLHPSVTSLFLSSLLTLSLPPFSFPLHLCCELFLPCLPTCQSSDKFCLTAWLGSRYELPVCCKRVFCMLILSFTGDPARRGQRGPLLMWVYASATLVCRQIAVYEWACLLQVSACKTDVMCDFESHIWQLLVCTEAYEADSLTGEKFFKILISYTLPAPPVSPSGLCSKHRPRLPAITL